MANSVDPDETPRSAASHLGLNCLLRPVCPNTYGKYGNVLDGHQFSMHIFQAILIATEKRGYPHNIFLISP